MADADALRPEEMMEIAKHWTEAPPLASCVRALVGATHEEEKDEVDHGPPRELTEEEWKAMVEREKASAERDGRLRNLSGVS